jgi:spermidine/putrescine transport system permease protein
MGVPTIIAAHVLFNVAVLILLVRSRLAGLDRSLIEASNDLYATPWGTFRQITLPLLAPAMLAGFLLAFTFSFEDFIIAFFVAGPNNTLPIYIFSSIRRGITPEINAIGTVVLSVSFTLLIIAQFLLRDRRRGSDAFLKRPA